MKKDMQKLSGGEVVANVSARTLDADEMAQLLQKMSPQAKVRIMHFVEDCTIMWDAIHQQETHAGKVG